MEVWLRCELFEKRHSPHAPKSYVTIRRKNETNSNSGAMVVFSEASQVFACIMLHEI